MDRINNEKFYKDKKMVEKNHIFDFEKEILVLGVCENFIEVRIVEYEDKYNFQYNLDKLMNFQMEIIRNPYQLLDYIEKTFLAVKKGKENLLDENRYILTPENTFFDRDKNIKIRYVPIEGEIGEQESFKVKNNLISDGKLKFLKRLKELCDEEIYGEYIDRIIETLTLKNLEIVSLINFVGELKRDAYLCGWNNYSRS